MLKEIKSAFAELSPFEALGLIVTYLVAIHTGVVSALIPTYIIIVPFIIYLFLVARKLWQEKKSSRSSWALACFSCLLVLSTFVNGGDAVGAVASVLLYAVIVMVFEYYGSEKIMTPIKVFCLIGSLLLIADTISIFLFPEGLGEPGPEGFSYFLGYKSYRVWIAIPTILFASIWSLDSYHRIQLPVYLLAVLAVASSVMSGATMGSVTLVLDIVGLLIISKMGNRPKSADFRILVPVTFALALVITLPGLITQALSPALELVGKTSTLSGRTIIWDKTWGLILTSPLLGFGYVQPETYAEIMGFAGATTPHNLPLAVLGYSGLLGIIAVIVAGVFAFRDYRPGRDAISDCIALIILMNTFMGITSCNLFAAFVLPMLSILELRQQAILDDKNQVTAEGTKEWEDIEH